MSGTKERFIIKPNMDNYKSMSDYLGQILIQGKSATVNIEEGEHKMRSLSVNGLQHAWIKEVSEWSGNTAEYIRRHDKVEFGIPILLHEDSEVARDLGWALNKLGFESMSPEQKMRASDLFSVTSLMSSRQHREYRNQVQNFYADAGIVLVVR